MKRAQYAKRGPVPQDVIEAVDFELPPPGPGQALIEVLAAPINPSDVLTLTGEYGMLPPLPAVGGNEGVGRVAKLGPDVEGLQVGQTVLLPVSSGTWATHVLADARRLMPVPGNADPRQLAMMTVNPPTALLMLSDFVDLKPGEWVIQNAANSAVGGYVIQLAKIRGLNTVNVVRREAAIPAVRQAGAEVVLVDGDDLHERVAAATGGAKIRLGIDAIGGMSTDHVARSVAEGGIVVNYGAMSGEPCMISPRSFVFRDLTLRGFWLALWFRKAAPQRQREVFAELAQLIAAGKLSARIQATFPVERIKEAVAQAAAGGRDGKILIVPNG